MTARVECGDCRDVMAGLAPESVDAIVSDPPYGLGFMGKGWDHAVPGVEFWTAALRVAKPGAHLVAFGGTRTYHRLAVAIEDAGWEIRDTLSWLYGSGFPKSHNGPWGGTALKPAWEPIILARKPLSGTVAATVQAHGTGALNIDGCRIHAPEGVSTRGRVDTKHGESNSIGSYWSGAVDESPRFGRWPANVALDEAAAAMLDAQSGTSASRRSALTSRPGAVYGSGAGLPAHTGVYGFDDAGGASRFFYCAKASRSERNAGLDGFDEGMPRGLGMGDNAVGSGRGSLSQPRANVHPTVKPLALMRWLCRLVTPPGGLILDPFTGSGSTGCAAVIEGFRFVGAELSPEYAAIARARIAHHAAQLSADMEAAS